MTVGESLPDARHPLPGDRSESSSSGNGHRASGNAFLVVIAETWRRNVVNVAFIVYVVLIGLIAVGSGSFSGSGSAMQPLLVLLTLIIGCRIIGPEFSSGTLQLILAKPINRSTYLLSRVAGTLVSVWTALLFVAVCNLIGRAISDRPLRVETLLLTMLNIMADTLLVVALLALFGSLTRSYLNVAIYVVLLVGCNAGQGVFGMLRMARPAIAKTLSFIPKILVFIDDNLFAGAPIDHFDRDFLLLAASNALIALAAACFAFRRREVPYGAD
ncbi:MAG TPA: ABC transporter permease subunit [Thermoanaerobaculia bacterium]|nr:ABC transporter permease subunit [Thermoanaerobaculia bacterium]